MRLAKINAAIKISIYEDISKVTKSLKVFFQNNFPFCFENKSECIFSFSRKHEKLS